MDFTLIE